MSYLSGGHGRVRLYSERVRLAGEVDDDVLGLLQLGVIVGVDRDAVGQRQRLGGALACLQLHPVESGKCKSCL